MFEALAIIILLFVLATCFACWIRMSNDKIRAERDNYDLEKQQRQRQDFFLKNINRRGQ